MEDTEGMAPVIEDGRALVMEDTEGIAPVIEDGRALVIEDSEEVRELETSFSIELTHEGVEPAILSCSNSDALIRAGEA
jgi:hypothetical protein